LKKFKSEKIRNCKKIINFKTNNKKFELGFEVLLKKLGRKLLLDCSAGFGRWANAWGVKFVCTVQKCSLVYKTLITLAHGSNPKQNLRYIFTIENRN
jgi:hypothetical protein